MRNVKQQMRELVERLPEDCTWEKVAYRVLVSLKLAKAEEQFAAGEGIPHDQVMREMEEWLESSGAPSPRPTSNAI
jgi:hypothetical protein